MTDMEQGTLFVQPPLDTGSSWPRNGMAPDSFWKVTAGGLLTPPVQLRCLG